MRRALPLAFDIGQSIGQDIGGPVSGFVGYQVLVSLFSSGEEGVLIPSINDARAEGKLWQDSGKTTLATAADDPVGYIEDYSGNGNDLSQSTATARPLLKQDGNGNWYLQFDGTDDYLASTAEALRITGDLTLVAGVHKTDAADYFVFMSAQTGTTTVNQYEWRTTNEVAADARQVFIAADGSAREEDVGTTAGGGYITQATNTVAHVRRSSGVNIIVGGDDDSRSSEQTLDHTKVPTSDASSEFRIMSRAASALYSDGRFYGGAVVNRVLTSAELLSAREYVASQMGVTL